MFRMMEKARKNRKGFTLVELMVVVVIIGILVAIVIPVYGAVQTNAANRAHDANDRILHGAGLMLVAEDGNAAAGTYTKAAPGNLADYIEVWPDVPDRANENGAIAGTDQTYQVVIAGADGAFTVTVSVVADAVVAE